MGVNTIFKIHRLSSYPPPLQLYLQKSAHLKKTKKLSVKYCVLTINQWILYMTIGFSILLYYVSTQKLELPYSLWNYSSGIKRQNYVKLNMEVLF